ncbi:MAG TPA: hypothetical protein VHC22_03165 [Pirellulales bacterium]|nr:hypothetical protein [Pirellulales bacterium]
MTRRHRTSPRAGLFTGREFSRLSAAILMLVVLAMIIASASRPATWTWLTGEGVGRAADAYAPKTARADLPAWQETVRAGEVSPDDPEERDAAREEFEAVSDKAALAAEEMPSYWRLLRWACSQSFADMQARARRNVLYTQLWERPDKYRGELITMRLHVVRTLVHEAPRNSAGVQQVCEVWGWTDESQSFPYVTVLVERPPALKLGAKVEQDGTFVGYFLKTMAYTDALGERRASPMLLGRLRCEERPTLAISNPDDSIAFWRTMAVGGGLAILVAASWYWRRARRRPPAADLTKTADTEHWLQAVQADDAPIASASGNGRWNRAPLPPLFDAHHEPDEGGYE